MNEHTDGTRRGVLLGTFFVSMGLLVYEIFSARLLAIVLDSSMIYVVFGLAMLGMSAASSILSLFRVRLHGPRRDRVLAAMCIGLGVAYFLTMTLLTFVNEAINDEIREQIFEGGLSQLISYVRSSSALHSALVGAILGAPYILFGLTIALLFETSAGREYHRIYFADLFGAALGCLLIIVALEYGGYRGALFVVLVLPFLAALCFAPPRSRLLQVSAVALGIFGCFVAVFPRTAHFLEPRPEINQLARNWSNPEANKIEQIWHTWNNYTRVALLRRTPTDDARPPGYIFSLARGESHGALHPWSRGAEPGETVEASDPAALPTAVLGSVFDPDRVLVVFAGAGPDMIGIDAISEGRADITGLELNRQLVEHAARQPGFRLDEFFARPNIHMQIAEGREFLERDRSLYDSIVLSWSGASISQYVGTSGSTAQYLYTREAFESYLEHLAPGGTLATMNGSKILHILMLRQILSERGVDNIRDSFIVLALPTLPPNWGSPLDNLHLLAKPGGFTPAEVEQVEAAVGSIGYRIALSPGFVAPGYEILNFVVNEPDVQRLVAFFQQEIRLDVSIPTDDRPFGLSMLPRGHVFQDWFWNTNHYWSVVRYQYLFFVGFVAMAFVLILGPLLLTRGPGWSRLNILHMIYFWCLGMGFMLIEVGLVQKLSLLLGNPGYSIAVVLASVILSTGFGSLASERLFESGRLNFVRTVLLLLLAVAATLAFIDRAIDLLLPLPILVKAVLVVLILFPLGFLMGQLFPQGLRRLPREQPNIVPWAWAINGASSTVAASLAVVMAQPFGFNAIVLAGACVYAVVLLLPPYQIGRTGTGLLAALRG